MTKPPVMVDVALRYAARGWHVFPLYEPVDYDTCSCFKAAKCASRGKHPRNENGSSGATTDTAIIERWWGQWPKANIGIACAPSGIVVIDIDPRHGGDESYTDLVQKHGDALTQTLTSLTGGGGQHYVFLAPQGTRISDVANRPGYDGPLGPGVDVRAQGYIVAPPSLHESGKKYHWEEEGEQPARLPLALFELLTARPQQIEHDLVSAADILAGVDSGNRDWELFRLASKLRYADVPYDWARTLVLEAAANCRPAFPASEALKKLDSAYKRYEAGKNATVAPEDMRHIDGLEGRVLLDDVLAKPIPPPDWLIDGFLVRGFIHLLYGESGHGKTTVGLEWIRQVIAAGETVVFIDEESGHIKIAGLMQDMGISNVDEHLHYFQMPGIGPEDIAALFAYLDSVQPSLVVFDSLTDQMSNFGIDDADPVAVNGWFKVIPKELVLRSYRPCVVLLDHVTKAKENVSHSAGSRAKRQKSDVLWYLEKIEEFDRQTLGKVTLTLYKNNPGMMPGKHTLAVGTRDGLLICEPFDATQHGGRALTEKHEKLLSAITDCPRGNAELQGILECGHDTVVRLAQDLIALFLIERTGTGRMVKYQLCIRSDESNVRSDETVSSDFSSDSPPPLGGNRTKRRTADKTPWWEKLDQDSEDLL